MARYLAVGVRERRRAGDERDAGRGAVAGEVGESRQPRRRSACRATPRRRRRRRATARPTSGVEVDEQHGHAVLSQGRGEMDGGGGPGSAAFLVGDGDDKHGGTRSENRVRRSRGRPRARPGMTGNPRDTGETKETGESGTTRNPAEPGETGKTRQPGNPGNTRIHGNPGYTGNAWEAGNPSNPGFSGAPRCGRTLALLALFRNMGRSWSERAAGCRPVARFMVVYLTQEGRRA